MKKTILSTLTIIAIGFGVNAQNIPANGLIAHYKFENNYNDNAGINDGTNLGSVFAADRFGNANNAIYLDGNNVVTFGDIDLINPDFTISFWLNYDSIPAGYAAKILTKRDICSSGNFLDIAVNPTSIGMEVYSGANNANAAGTGDITIHGSWYHVVFVVDQTNQETHSYLDGVLISTTTWATSIGSIDNPAPFGISNSPCIPVNANNIGYSGYIDDIRVYNRATNQTEVTALFNEANPTATITENLNNEISVYPNPAKNQLTINVAQQIEIITIVDITGKAIKSITPTSKTIDVSELTKGIYFLKVKTTTSIVTSKFIKA
jgi:hypothetical protein